MSYEENLKNLENEIGKNKSDFNLFKHQQLNSYTMLEDGTDISMLPSGKYIGNNLVNVPPQLKSVNRIAVNIDDVDGYYKKITVRNLAMPYEFVTYGDWDWQKGNHLAWGSSVIGRKLKMGTGIEGEVFENIFWHGDHTEINIQGKVTIPSGYQSQDNGFIRIASNSIVYRYQKNRFLTYSVPANFSDGSFSPVTLALTEYGNLNVYSPQRWASLSFSIGTVIKPDSWNYSKAGVPPFYVGKNHNEGDYVYDGTKE